MLLLSKLLILMTLLKYCQRSLCCSWKYLRILQRPGLLLDVSIPQGPELHLDLSSLQWPALQLGMSTPQGPELNLDLSTLWTVEACVASRRVYTTGVWASNVMISKRKHKRYDIGAYYRNESKPNQKLNFDVCIPQRPMICSFALLLLFFINKKMLSLRLIHSFRLTYFSSLQYVEE
jgi:hypothetical protein